MVSNCMTCMATMIYSNGPTYTMIQCATHIEHPTVYGHCSMLVIQILRRTVPIHGQMLDMRHALNHHVCRPIVSFDVDDARKQNKYFFPKIQFKCILLIFYSLI